MSMAKPTHSIEEIAEIGAEIYDRLVRPSLAPEDDGKFVAVDILSEEYEVDEDDYSAIVRLRSRKPSAEIFLGRVGQLATCRIRVGK